jgi:hypothetical protein
MPTLSDWLLMLLLALGLAFIVGNFVLGLVKGKVFAPPGAIEMAATKKVRGYFLTRAEAPKHFWYHMIVYGALTAMFIFLLVAFLLHPERFHW